MARRLGVPFRYFAPTDTWNDYLGIKKKWIYDLLNEPIFETQEEKRRKWALMKKVEPHYEEDVLHTDEELRENDPDLANEIQKNYPGGLGKVIYDIISQHIR